jgi:hypothetical protein
MDETMDRSLRERFAARALEFARLAEILDRRSDRSETKGSAAAEIK